MIWPSWLWIGTPAKFFLWVGNRLATWTGSLYFWKRFRSRRAVWVWLLLINTVSLAALALLLFWLHVRASHRPFQALMRQ